MGAMYVGMYPAFKDTLAGMVEGFSDTMGFIPGIEDMASYVGFLNVELYQIFWVLILAILIGFIAATLISKEIEAKTIDLLMSNPISRKHIVLERYLGIIPFILIIDFATMLTVYGMTSVINEEVNFANLFMTHIMSVPYFLAVAGVGLLISVIFDEKMKASIIMIAIIVGMYILESVSLMIPKYASIGYISLTHYYNPYDILKFGKVDSVGIIILITVTIECLLVAMLYFDRRDIAIS
jgi:ABC-2 type transport system permease protein